MSFKEHLTERVRKVENVLELFQGLSFADKEKNTAFQTKQMLRRKLVNLKKELRNESRNDKRPFVG